MGCKIYNPSEIPVTFRKVVYRIGNVFSITPWYDFEKGKLKYATLNKLYSAIFGFIFGFLLLILPFIKSTEYSENAFEQFLSCLTTVVSLCLIQYLVLGSAFTKQGKWLLLLNNLSARHDNEFRCQVCYNSKIQFMLAHCFFTSVGIFSMNVWVSSFGFNMEYVLEMLTELTPEYYCFLCAILSSSLVLYSKCLYEDLADELQKTTDNYLMIPKQERFVEGYVKSITDIEKKYRQMSILVRNYNDIFGFVNLLILWHSIVHILRCANLVLIIMDNPYYSWTMSLSIVLWFTISLGESIYIIMCCEKATSAGNKMKQLCHELQENFGVESKARRELFKLAEIVKTYRPKFTAANFFVINQGIILKMLSISTTYLIVIIQFYGTIHTKYWKNHPQNKSHTAN